MLSLLSSYDEDVIEKKQRESGYGLLKISHE